MPHGKNCTYVERLIFVSPQKLKISEIAGNPDDKCQLLAEDASLPNKPSPLILGTSTFKALLAHPDGIWSRMNAPEGVTFKNRKDEVLFITSEPNPLDIVPVISLINPIRIDANGFESVGPVWTGIADGWVSDDSPCEGWSNPAAPELVGVGASEASDNDWYQFAEMGCGGSAYIYCVQVY